MTSLSRQRPRRLVVSPDSVNHDLPSRWICSRRHRNLSSQCRYDARTVGGSSSNVELIHEYLRWVNKQTRMLKNRISSDDLERLVLTPVYWALQTASRENPDNSVFDLVAAEISDRDTTLISAADEVKSEIERWNQPKLHGRRS